MELQNKTSLQHLRLASFYLRVLELLLDVLDNSGAVEADECAGDELGVDGMGARDLGGDAHEGADLSRGQLPQLAGV